VRIDRWQLLALLIALPTLIPLLVIAASFLYPDPPVWAHLRTYVLPQVVVNTLWLVLGTATLTFLLGTSLAWLTSVHEFPGRRFFSWALMLPMAMPGYVLAFVFLGWLDYAGPLQTQLREWFGEEAGSLSLSPRAGSIVVLSLALYPYVFLLSRGAFLTQGRRALEIGQSLGLNRARGFQRVALPLARPWIAGGIMLVVMETLADFGAVSVFNYDTFTTAIYKTWFGLFSVSGALQLASVLLLFVLAAIVIEKRTRAGARYVSLQGGVQPQRIELQGSRGWLSAGYCCATLALAFVMPAVQLLSWSLPALSSDLDPRYFSFVTHSLSLGGMGAVLTLTLAVLLAYAARNNSRFVTRAAVRIGTLGYALPGTILAIGFFVPVVALNNLLQRLIDTATTGTVLVLQNTLLVMMLAYAVRFLAVAYTPVESHMQRMPRSLDEVSRGLGVSGAEMLRTVHWPLIRSGCLIATILVFVDIMKEMPITLMTRPFGWDTLAVRVFELTSEGEWRRAALPSLAIVLSGLLPVALLTRFSDHAARA